MSGNWEGEGKWKMWFNSGGCIDFGRAMLKAGEMGKYLGTMSTLHYCSLCLYTLLSHLYLHNATELEQWNANIAIAQVSLSPLADHKPGYWLFPV